MNGQRFANGKTAAQNSERFQVRDMTTHYLDARGFHSEPWFYVIDTQSPANPGEEPMIDGMVWLSRWRTGAEAEAHCDELAAVN